MRLLFVGGTVDNSELDLEDEAALTKYYPLDSEGRSRAQYRLFEIGRDDGAIHYAVYAALDLADEEIERIIEERQYPRRFQASERETIH